MMKHLPYCLVFFLLLGCSNSGSGLSGLVPCKGTVTLDGSPLAEALVMLIPEESGDMRSASATTDTNGIFTMGTLQPLDGVTPGNFIVTVVKYEKFGPAPEKAVNDDGEETTPPHPVQNVLPEKYAAKQTSDIKLTVGTSGNKNVTITLTK